MELSNKSIDILLNTKSLANLSSSNKFTPKLSFDIAKFMKRFEDVAKTYMEERKKIIEKWCDKDIDDSPLVKEESGRQMYTFNGHLEEYQKDMEELLEQDSEINAKKKITVNLLTMPTGVLSPADMNVLDCIVEFKDESD